jgi:hypothetical protein
VNLDTVQEIKDNMGKTIRKMLNVEERIDEVLNHMVNDYRNWIPNVIQDEERVQDWASKLRVEYGNKYIKIWQDNSICMFIVNVVNDKKFAFGDILKPAGWRAPARNFARGSVFDTISMEGCVRWTGAS